MKVLIRNAEAVLPHGIEKTDVLIENERIASVGAPAGTRADEVIDATGLHLLPGVIDDQVHFRDPGLTHKEDLHTGSLACAKGGVTTFLEMPNTQPNTITVEALHAKLDLAALKHDLEAFVGGLGAHGHDPSILLEEAGHLSGGTVYGPFPTSKTRERYEEAIAELEGRGFHRAVQGEAEHQEQTGGRHHEGRGANDVSVTAGLVQ